MRTPDLTPARRPWPDYAAVWRWHFYAGLLCIPFVLWLSITGSIYVFKPQVEAWIDAPYDNLALTGHPASAQAQVTAALAAVPGASFSTYELPQTPSSAPRIILRKGDDLFRVYLNPETRQVLNVVNEDDRLMKQISFLHGELAIGDRGSLIVETAACWAIVMILTGIFLWWPRTMTGLAGVLFPRLTSGKRLFWRDLHAVTGIWVCALALFLLFTGLPWAKNWGAYLKEIRTITNTAEGPQDWTTGRSSEIAERRASDQSELHAGHDHGAMISAAPTYAPLDRLVPLAATLNLAPPVLIAPAKTGPYWIAKSDAQNRMLRATIELDPATATVVGRRDFGERHPIDQVIGIGISAHEGQLFGWFNQALSLTAALGLITLGVSAIVLWFRRRPQGVLGAPTATSRPRLAPTLIATIVVLAILFPLFGASLAIVLIVERLILKRIAPARLWLGLST